MKCRRYDNICVKFSLTTIIGLIGSIIGIIGIILYFGEPFFHLIIGILGLILLIIAVFSSFYVNKNSKIGSILLLIMGILIFFYSAELLSPFQDIGHGYIINVDFGHILYSYDLQYLSGIILFISGIWGLMKDKMSED